MAAVDPQCTAARRMGKDCERIAHVIGVVMSECVCSGGHS